MREIKECTAEVFRRSEKRIAERKRNRNRILLMCIPLCLVMTVVSAAFLPALLPAGSDHEGWYGMDLEANGNAASAENFGDAFESDAFAYTAVELRTVGPLPEHTEQVTDRAVVADLFDTVQSLFADGNGDGQTVCEDQAQESAGGQDQFDTDAENKGAAYTIAFLTKEGERTVYHLDGNTLSHGDTDETIFLSNAQVAELLAVFGLAS